MSEPEQQPLGQSPGSVEDGEHLDDEFSIYADAPGEDGTALAPDQEQGQDEEPLP
jgi:hypothetical protein